MKQVSIYKRALSLLILITITGATLANCSPSKPSWDEASIGEVTKSGVQRVMSPDVATSELDDLVAGNSTFAFNLYQAIREEDGNLFYSPFSVSLALAMAYAGAQGETKEQMEAALSFTLSQENLHAAFNALDLILAQRSEQVPVELGTGFQLNIANSTWTQEDHRFREEYLDVLAENYGAGLHLVDFANATEDARQAINNWVSKETEGKIKDLIPAGGIDPLTRLILANAIYFKASWENAFEKDATRDGDFTLLEGGQTSAQMMTYYQPMNLAYARDNGYQAVELPYVGGQVSMLLLVPDIDLFGEFEKSLSDGQIRSLVESFEYKNVLLTMPIFSFESQFSLANTLREIGMSMAFEPDQADFSGIDGSRDLFISDVIHKAFVDVNEEGTEAAAVTEILAGSESVPGVDVELTINRPFIFLIRDKPTGMILFIGRVTNPA
ncbi:MAG: serpin family protein [Anaerolineales bacterium]|jgi:serpin B